MSVTLHRVSLSALLIAVVTVSAVSAADYSSSLKAGKVNLNSAGVLTFGPNGILFVGDSVGAAIFAIDTEDRGASSSQVSLGILGINEKVAALLGTTADQILINDLAVNPISKKADLSVSRGRGPNAAPVILRIEHSGRIHQLSLENAKHSMVSLLNAPGPDDKDRRGRSRRLEAITDLAFVDGRVIIAGLSNEEFASKLRSIPFPWKDASEGTSVEIFHGAHGRFETHSPVRTFVPYEIKAESHVLASLHVHASG